MAKFYSHIVLLYDPGGYKELNYSLETDPFVL